MEVIFERERETKNTIRFAEVITDSPPRIGTLYIQKWTVKQLGSPTKVKVILEGIE